MLAMKTSVTRGLLPLALAAVVPLAACAPAVHGDVVVARGDADGAWRELGEYVRAQMRQTGTVGVSVAVVDGESARTAGFGMDDREAGQAATSQTLFRAGSVTKSITATAVMALVEKGLVDLDRPVQAYVPEFRVRSRFADARPITLRHLLDHHAGLTTNRVKGAMAPRPAHFSTVLADLAEDYVSNPPDTLYQYSNLAYDVLGCVIERASGERFEDYVGETVFAPAGMRRSSFDHARVGKSYEGGKTYPDWPIRDVPAGGLVTDADDLGRYMRVTLARGRSPGEGGGTILSERSYAEMWRDQNDKVPLDLDMRLGLGWMFRGADYPGAGRLVRHSGVVGRYRAELELLPDQDLGVAVLSNSAEGHQFVFDVAKRALDLMLQARGGPAPAVDEAGGESAGAGEPGSAGFLPASRVTQASRPQHGGAYAYWPDGDLEPYAGTYALAIGTLTARPAGGQLAFELFGVPWATYRQSDGSVGLRTLLFGFVPFVPPAARGMQPMFVRVDGREYLAIRQTGFYLLGEKLQPEPVPAAWQGMIGQYDVANWGDDYRLVDSVALREDNGFLHLDVKYVFGGLRESRALRILSDTQAVVAGKGRGLGETVFRLPGAGPKGGDRLRWSGLELERR